MLWIWEYFCALHVTGRMQLKMLAHFHSPVWNSFSIFESLPSTQVREESVELWGNSDYIFSAASTCTIYTAGLESVHVNRPFAQNREIYEKIAIAHWLDYLLEFMTILMYHYAYCDHIVTCYCIVSTFFLFYPRLIINCCVNYWSFIKFYPATFLK